MSALQDDIARVAALRGRSVDECMDAAAQLKAQEARLLTEGAVTTLFVGYGSHESAWADVDQFDHLPPASRAFIAESPMFVNAYNWRRMLAQVSEGALIAAARKHLAENMPYDTRRKYGANHPEARIPH